MRVCRLAACKMQPTTVEMAAFCELQQSVCIRDCCPLCIDVELAWVLLGLMWVLSQPRPNVTVMQRVPPDYQIVRQSCVEVALSLPLQHLAVVCCPKLRGCPAIDLLVGQNSRTVDSESKHTASHTAEGLDTGPNTLERRRLSKSLRKELGPYKVAACQCKEAQ